MGRTDDVGDMSQGCGLGVVLVSLTPHLPPARCLGWECSPGSRDKPAKEALIMDTANLSLATGAPATRLPHTDAFDPI